MPVVFVAFMFESAEVQASDAVPKESVEVQARDAFHV